ncbi:hypothetical protein KCV01_g6343, partial [Aureobasidium melanogenum]
MWLRLYYVHTVATPNPVVGDSIGYYSYAWNLLQHHTFSIAAPHASTVSPDGFRDPGYPVFLASLVGSGEMGPAFIQRVFVAQAILSGLTVWIFALLARRWVGFAAACATGLILGVWPHLLTLTANLLTETLVGFLVAIGLLLMDETVRRHGNWRPLLTGLVFSLAGLTNAVLAPFAPLLAAWYGWRRKEHRRMWAFLLVAALVPLLAWSLRGISLSSGQMSADNRVKINLVQGAWPEYHPASQPSLSGDPEAVAIMNRITAEYDALRRNTFQGLGVIARRLASDPARYALWYAYKPVELWGWSIGIGEGDIYVHTVYRSPLTMQPTLRALTGILFFLTPFFTLLAFVGGILTFLPSVGAPPGQRVAVLLATWITLVYWVLQSDARYSTPFRGIEILLAVFTVHTGVLALGRRRKREFANGRITS